VPNQAFIRNWIIKDVEINPRKEGKKGMSILAKPTPRRSSFNRKKIILAALAVILFAGGVTGYTLWKRVQTTAQAVETPMQTATVQRGDLQLFATGTGTLIPSAEATFGFSASGQVTDVLVVVGDVVDAGQELARLDDTAAQKELLLAQRAISEMTSPSSIAAADLAVANAKVTVAEKRSTLAYLLSPDVVYWEEQVTKAETAVAQVKADAAASPSTDADKKVKDAERTVLVCKNSLAQAWLDYWNDYVPETFLTTVTEGRTVKQVVVSPSDTDVAAARAEYTLAQHALQEAEDYLTALTTGTIPDGATGDSIAALTQTREDLVGAQDAVKATHLYAAIHGTIMSVGFQIGDMVGSGTSVKISDLDQPYHLEIYLDESDWGNIKAGYPVEVTFDILSEKVYTGRVLSVDPSLTSTGGSSYIHAYVQLDAAIDTVLPFGTGASVDVIGGQTSNALLIPVEALHEIAEGKYAVFVLVDGTPKMRQVEIGLQDLVYAEVKSGLNEGDVVTTGITETN
jgi:multidrug efflux pump subunit AcrA (membrane-fusion protein)